MRIRLLLLLGWMVPFVAYAQTQQGVAKTKGRLNSDGTVTPGTLLKGVTIKVKGRTAVLSDDKGAFTFPVPGQQYSLETVRKNGYALVDPETLSRQYAYSKDNPLVLVLETPGRQADDELANERKIRRNLQRQLMQREDVIEQLREENRITQEEYRTRLQELYAQQETSEKLIAKMVEYYSRIDYDQLDDYNRQISTYILNGELARADSLLSTKGDINTRIAALRRHQSVNADERAALAKRQESLEQSEAYARKELEDLAQDCMHKHDIYRMQMRMDSAGYYMEMRAGLDTTNVEWQLDAYAYLAEYLSEYDRASVLIQRALRQAVQQFGENSPEVAKCHYKMLVMDCLQQAYDKCLKQASKVLEMNKFAYGGKHKNVVNTLNLIGTVYWQLSDYKNALKYLQAALDMERDLSGENSEEYAMILGNIGTVYKELDDYERSLEYTQKALEINRNLFGDSRSVVATNLFNLGNIYFSHGDFARAMEYYQQSVGILQKVYGEHHPSMADLLSNIGDIYVTQGDWVRGMEYYQKALAIYQEVLGEHHTAVATLWSDIGYVYQLQEDYVRAMEYYQKALAIALEVYGEHHTAVAGSWISIGRVYKLQGDYARAMEYYQKALVIYQEVYGEHHTAVASILKEMGDVYRSQKDYARAMECYEEALSILKAVYGERHQDVALLLYSLGGVYVEQEDYPRAMDHFRKALDMAREFYGEKHPLVAGIMNDMGALYAQQGDYAAAVDYFRKVLEIRKEVLGECHPDVLMSYYNIVMAFYSLEDYPSALLYTKKALEIARTLYGEDAEQSELYRNGLYQLYQQLLKNTDEYEEEYRSFLSEVVVMVRFSETDSVAARQGLEGEYLLLETSGGWNLDSTAFLLSEEEDSEENSEEASGAEETTDYVLMKGGKIFRYSENIVFYLKFVGKEEKQKILEAYRRWKKTGEWIGDGGGTSF